VRKSSVPGIQIDLSSSGISFSPRLTDSSFVLSGLVTARLSLVQILRGILISYDAILHSGDVMRTMYCAGVVQSTNTERTEARWEGRRRIIVKELSPYWLEVNGLDVELVVITAERASDEDRNSVICQCFFAHYILRSQSWQKDRVVATPR
jgi:hypothetical protein